jgi:predicted nucleotidyltransferase
MWFFDCSGSDWQIGCTIAALIGYNNITMDRTVSTLSSTDLASYRKSLKRRQRAKSPSSARLEKAHEIAYRAALILKDQFGVKKVVLFGSALHPKLYHAHSDIDLAVWGLSGRTYFQAVGVLQSLDPDFKIDLISFDDALPALREGIQRDGKEL